MAGKSVPLIDPITGEPLILEELASLNIPLKKNDKRRLDRIIKQEKRGRPKSPKNLILENLPSEIVDRSMLEAQKMFLAFVPIDAIAKHLGIDHSQLKKAIEAKGGWRDLRNELTKEVKEGVKHRFIGQLNTVGRLSLGLIELALTTFAEACRAEARAPDLEEAQIIAGIFSRLHKAKISEEIGDNSDKTKTSLTPMDVISELAKDSYLQKAIESQKDIKEDEPQEVHEVTEESLENPEKSDSLAYTYR